MSDSEDHINSNHDSSPLMSSRSLPSAATQPMKHPKKLWNVHRRTWSRDDLRTNIDQYLQHVAMDQPQCKNVLRGGSILLQCSCLATHLNDTETRERVTDYLMTFLFQTTRKEQTLILTQRIRQSKKAVGNSSSIDNNSYTNADKEHCRFALPGEEDVMICSSALLTLLGFSRHVWAHCLKCADDCKHVDDKIMPQHGARRSNSGNALDESIAAALETFFESQIKKSDVINSSEDNNEDINETVYTLRSTTTKKGLYELFCHEQGWELIKSVEGNVKPEPRMDQVQKPICSLSSFLAYWKKNYTQLDVPFSRRGNDSLASPEQQSQNLYSPLEKKSKKNRATPMADNGEGAVERRSFAETTNLITSPRSPWAATTTATTTPKKIYDDSEKLITDPNVLQSRNLSLQYELKQCREELATERVVNRRLNTALQWQIGDAGNEKEESRRLSDCLQKKEYTIERLEAENKHLQAAIALFRVNLPSTTATESTVSTNPLKRKLESASLASQVADASYIESRDEIQDETTERQTDIGAFQVKRLRI